MAVIGLSKPFVAKYNNDGNTVTYTGGTVLGKAISFSAELEEGDSNDLYGDNGVCETDKSFSGGTMTIGTDDLTNESSALILGITPAEDGELVYDDDMTAPSERRIIRKPVRKHLKALVWTHKKCFLCLQRAANNPRLQQRW